MAQVSISEAARLSGISRSNFYKNYIRQGKLSVTKDHQGRPQVDVSEIIRVFGGLHGDSNLMCPEIQEVTGSKHSEEIILGVFAQKHESDYSSSPTSVSGAEVR